MPFVAIPSLSTRLRRTVALLLGCGGVLVSLSIWGRVPADVLADADRAVASYGPALTGSDCPVDGKVSRDAHGAFLMCWKQRWTRP